MVELTKLFRPHVVAIVGASDKNPWSALVARSLDAIGFKGPIHLINSRGTAALGRETSRSCAGLGHVDAAFVALPAAQLIDGIEDMARNGVRYGCVVTSGFAEAGGKGAAAQNQIFSRAAELGVTLLGPNSLGFTNFIDKVSLSAIPLKLPHLDRPSIGLVSQSGATAALMYAFAHQQGISLSYSIAMGNEAMVDLADVISFLVKDDATRTIAVFAETIRNPTLFRQSAREAGAAGKPIVIFKVGSAALTASVAQAHTGALVGDDRVFDAVCAEHNMIRVSSIEDLMITSDVLANTGRVDASKGFSLISISGGACEIMSDRGEETGIPFPQFDSQTRERLGRVLPDFAGAHNPLDITGAAMRNPEIYRGAIDAVAQDPNIGMIGIICEVPTDAQSAAPTSNEQLAQIAQGLTAARLPAVLIQQTVKPITKHAHEVLATHGLPILTGGIDHAARALGHLYSWSRGQGPSPVPPQEARDSGSKPRTEVALLHYLREAGVPTIPQILVSNRTAAIAAAQQLSSPVVLKICSKDIAHKTEMGGVLLNVVGDASVGEGYDVLMARARAQRPDAVIDGVIVAPMRTGGTELIVGVSRDPAWGLVMAVGAGGVWVELVKDSRLKLLPVSALDGEALVRSLRVAKLLGGYRGSAHADLPKLGSVIAAIGRAAVGLGPSLESLEINPLRVNGAEIEALDALAVWSAA